MYAPPDSIAGQQKLSSRRRSGSLALAALAMRFWEEFEIDEQEYLRRFQEDRQGTL